ncbi:OsmC family protein [Hugenholtzia roseola]|uniref:OsmC family protein n=1 Tax=Hugenholtzia roseola TaxID=1002 RepID=UPI000413D038|nr:OsmC family protein [Hugenholtzia roseola]
MSNLTFSLSGKSESSAKFRAKVRHFELLVDEPQALGGTDLAPNPVEYLLAAYAGCLNVVAHLVAKEYNFELKSLKINLKGEINPERLFGFSDLQRAGYQALEVLLEPETTASDPLLLEWLQEIERRCPVGDNLQNSTPVALSIQRREKVVYFD